mmetsp:Transcript_37885/g.83407  ORF Transcript_37885/g.83407 Transcript_37885/m.83407 type:complete len:241 (+) Transcript_37885:424-1146(+)
MTTVRRLSFWLLVQTVSRSRPHPQSHLPHPFLLRHLRPLYLANRLNRLNRHTRLNRPRCLKCPAGLKCRSPPYGRSRRRLCLHSSRSRRSRRCRAHTPRAPSLRGPTSTPSLGSRAARSTPTLTSTPSLSPTTRPSRCALAPPARSSSRPAPPSLAPSASSATAPPAIAASLLASSFHAVTSSTRPRRDFKQSSQMRRTRRFTPATAPRCSWRWSSMHARSGSARCILPRVVTRLKKRRT